MSFLPLYEIVKSLYYAIVIELHKNHFLWSFFKKFNRNVIFSTINTTLSSCSSSDIYSTEIIKRSNNSWWNPIERSWYWCTFFHYILLNRHSSYLIIVKQFSFSNNRSEQTDLVLLVSWIKFHVIFFTFQF